jgi:hypothetical protein
MTTAGWTWAQTVTLLAAFLTLAGAVITAALSYGLNQRAARRERQTREFAEALAVIEDYAELPYRIRRRLGTPQARHELTEQISQVQSRLAFHQGWLRMEGSGVARAYEHLVRTTKERAGAQMREAWLEPVLVEDAQVSLGKAYERNDIDGAREACIEAMREALGQRPLQRPPERAAAGRLTAGAGPAVTGAADGAAPR